MPDYDNFQMPTMGDGKNNEEPPDLDGIPNPGLVPSFPELIDMLNASLGWNYSDLARAMGYYDGSVVSRWISGERTPTPNTLQKLASTYRNAGYDTITVEHFRYALRLEEDSDSMIFGLPAHLVRLMRDVAGQGDYAVDFFYRRWSQDFNETMNFIRRWHKET
ncbi:MAG: helix-turn-helix transcriptional regulator [Anaerolineae bacterium]|nr:helix-turn-helix transcriptional regulator [Anaerolineae bacterium]